MAVNTCWPYLNVDIGLGADDRANAVWAEGLETLDEFKDFDDDRIKTICKSVRRPGGIKPNPLHTAHGALKAAGVANIGPTIHAPSITIQV